MLQRRITHAAPLAGAAHHAPELHDRLCHVLQDLIRAPADAQAASPPPRNWAPKPQLKRMPAHEVLENATFTNYEMLDNFVTDAGKLHPRRRTALQAKTHRYLNRQIKVGSADLCIAPDMDALVFTVICLLAMFSLWPIAADFEQLMVLYCY